LSFSCPQCEQNIFVSLLSVYGNIFLLISDKNQSPTFVLFVTIRYVM
jgi:hypothetical protein